MSSERSSSGLMIRILVAEHHSEIQELLCQMLASEPDMEIVSAVAESDDAVEMIAELVPDVVIVDLNLPGGGIGLCKRIKELVATTQVIVLADDAEPDKVRQAMMAGVKDYLTGSFSRDELVGIVREAGKWRSFGRNGFGGKPPSPKPTTNLPMY